MSDLKMMRLGRMSGCLCGALLMLGACSAPPPVEVVANPRVPAGAKSTGGKHAIIETGSGAIEIEFFETDAPKAVENFRLLAEHGYYDGLIFHRVLKGFMLQGGDPLGNGTGGQSAWGGSFPDEIAPDSELYTNGYRRGIVAMANSGPNTNGSQFFIMHDNYPLPPNYVIFGKVTAGLDVVDAIANTPTTMGDGGEMSQPVTRQVIKKVTIRP
jgi:cyclophilin family peptidyl-prolyl cis-trans isomerase